NSADGSLIDASRPAINLLRLEIAFGEHPTERSHPESTAFGIRKSHPSSIDSIQQEPESRESLSPTCAAHAVREPKQCSTGSAGRGRVANIVKSASALADLSGSSSPFSNSLRSSRSETTMAS